MNRSEILKYLREVGEELGRDGVHGEIVLAGGAVMLLVIQSRDATKDVDAYFAKDSERIRTAARKVAEREGLREDWLNDGIKGFFYGTPPQTVLAEYPGLNVYSVTPEYMIAMKSIAGRPEDVADLKALIKLTKIQKVEDVFEIIEKYIPRQLLTTKTQYIVESIFDETENQKPDRETKVESTEGGAKQLNTGVLSARRSRRTCTSRCQTSKAPVSKCRCVCGGKNHGTKQ